MITARFDPHVHLLPPERTAGLMRWLHRGLPGVGIPADITAEDALADLRAAGAHALVNLLFPLRPGEAEELHRFGAELSRNEPGVIPVGGVHAEDADPEGVMRAAIEDDGMREARERLERDLQAAFQAAPDRIFFGTDYPAAMGTLDELHTQVAESAVGRRQLEVLARNAERFVREGFGLKTRA